MVTGGTLRIGARTNFHFHYKVYDDLGFMLYDPLVRYRPRRRGFAHLPAGLSDLEPRLIASLDMSDDNTVATCFLRRGVLSSHGNPLTARDVKWSWNRALLARRQGRFTARISPLKGPDSITVVDDHCVRFELEKPNVTFPHFLTSKYIHIYDSVECRKHATRDDPWAEEWLSRNSAGFGPYVVESCDPENDSVTYVANPNYWDGSSRRIERITREGVASVDRRVARFLDGEFDMVTSLSAQAFHALGEAADIDTYQVPGHDPLLVQMNCVRGPFASLEVRQAASYAIPYDDLIRDIWKGLARPMKSPFVDVCLGYTQEHFHYRRDIAKAKQLLAQAGLGNGFEAELLICSALSPHMMQAAQSVVAALRDIGVTLTIRDVEEPALREAGFAHAFDMLLDPHIHMVSDDYYISLCDYGDAKWGVENLNQFFSEELFALQHDCLKAGSEAERVAYAREMQRVILEGAPQLFLLQLDTLIAARKSVRGLAWDANGRLFFHDVFKT